MALEDLTPKELEAIMDGKAPIPTEEPEPAAAAPPPVVEAAPPPPPPPAAEETNGEMDAAPPPPTAEDLLEELRSRLEESDLRREKLEAVIEHERLLRERANTKAGIYKSTAMDLLREDPRREDISEDEDTSPPEVRRLTREVAALREEATTRAANDALGDFVRNIPDLSSDDESSRELLAAMQPMVKQGRTDYSHLYESGDPRLVRDTTKLILKAAYTEVKAQRLANAREQAKTRRIEQFSAARQAKLAAGSVQSAPAAAVPAREKALDEMTTTELAQLLDQMVPPPRPRRRL